MDALNQRIKDLETALSLALQRLGDIEPGDSRAVSDEFVAMAAVLTGNEDQQCFDIINRELEDRLRFPERFSNVGAFQGGVQYVDW